MRFAAGAYAVIFDDAGKVLFCHRRDCDFWNLPGGGVESGEAPWQAVVREVREETGLEVEVVRLAGLYCWTALDEVIYSFVCRVIGGALLTQTDETDGARYFALDDLAANTFLEHAARARDAALGQPEAVQRIPTGPSGKEQRETQSNGS
ncbi:MAG TPA: NUDIX domain-containing protein [Ktedonobacterales bacterium]|jgi:ADP-ribose pyrophosphatase YjhB (NUDIX family)|nr:NUDIX domain-containing protein [Ktedonobacterales bacterium]